MSTNYNTTLFSSLFIYIAIITIIIITAIKIIIIMRIKCCFLEKKIAVLKAYKYKQYKKY